VDKRKRGRKNLDEDQVHWFGGGTSLLNTSRSNVFNARSVPGQLDESTANRHLGLVEGQSGTRNRESGGQSLKT
jgi:hypothetical protein